MSLKNFKLSDIVVTDHSLERARQRLNINAENGSLLYIAKFKELIQKAEIRECNGKDIRCELVYQNTTYSIHAFVNNDKLIVKSIVPKDH